VVSPEDAADRRTLLRRAGVLVSCAGAAALAAGCGSQAKSAHHPPPRPTEPLRPLDVELLNRLLTLERRTVAAYTAGIPLLSRPASRTAKQFLGEELQHTGELISLVRASGGEPVPRLASYDLGHARNQADVIGLLQVLEQAQIAAYLDAIPRLTPGKTRAAAASIMASDAQHIAFLRLTNGQPPAPAAFVTGAD
jgi:hypothetical protein